MLSDKSLDTITKLLVDEVNGSIECGCEYLHALDEVLAIVNRKFSRREQRRARKNLEMFKTVGRRPWHVEMIGNGAELEQHAWDALKEPHYFSCNNSDGTEEVFKNYSCAVERRGPHLVEPNGFRYMSWQAEIIKHKQRRDAGMKSCRELSDEIWSGII